MKTLYVNVRYLIVPIMTVITIMGLYFGGIYAWIGVFLFGLNTIIDTLTKIFISEPILTMKVIPTE